MVHENQQKENAKKVPQTTERESEGGQSAKSPAFQLFASPGAEGSGNGNGANGAIQRKAAPQNNPAQMKNAPIQRKVFANDTEKEQFFADYKARAETILARWYKSTKTKDDRDQLTGAMFEAAARKIYDAKKDTKFIVPVEFALSQARLEGGVSRNERLGQGNVFNVAAYDSGVSSGEKKINTLEKGFDAYYSFMANNMLDDKTPEQLLEMGNFTKGANRTGGVYATNPVYEGEIKGQIGKMHMVDDGFSISASVGAGGKNKPADVAKIGALLVKVGYLSKDDVNDATKVSAAILSFQTTEIAPESAKWFKDRVKGVTNPTDIANMNIHIKNFTDGVISPNGSTIGVLYFMAAMGGKVDTVGKSTTGTAPTTPTTNTTTPSTNTTPTTKPSTTTTPTQQPANQGTSSGGLISSAWDYVSGVASDTYEAVTETVSETLSGWGDYLFGSDEQAKKTTKPATTAKSTTTAKGTTPPKAPTSLSISGSVGVEGQNNENDVKVVQTLLIKAGYLPALNAQGKTNVDGDCGKNTKAAITRFQSEKTGLQNPDGRIDPGGRTWKVLTGQSPAVTRPQTNNSQPTTNTNPKSNGQTTTKTEVAPRADLTASNDLFQQIQTNFPNGITVAIYANYAKTGDKAKDSNNAEFPRASGKFAKTFNAVGFDGSGKLTLGLAQPITNLDEITSAVKGIHELLWKEYQKTNPGAEGPRPAFTKINHLALFSHGMPYGMHLSSGGKYNLKNKTEDDQEKLKNFVTGIRGALTEGVHVSLFACNAGRETDGTEKEGVWGLGAADKQDGSSSFAASLAAELGEKSSVYAHLSAGHTVNNYSARVFGADAGKDATKDKAGVHIFHLLYPDAFATTEATRLKKTVDAVKTKMWKHYTTRMSDGHNGKFTITNGQGKTEKIELGAEMFADITRAKTILQTDWTTWVASNPV